MKKEHLKNITLLGLVSANLVLGSNILLDKKLWPSGYNFFNIDNFPLFKIFIGNFEEKNNYEKVVHLTLPENIIFNTGDQTTRFSINSNNPEYDEIIEDCNEILGAAFGSEPEKITEITSDEWFSSLMTNSVYLNYYTEYNSELFANFLGIRDTALSNNINTFSNIVINLSDNVSVYIEDSTSKKYYKIKTGHRFQEFKTIVKGIINNQNSGASEKYAINYSFDLNFDKSFGGQKTIIDSMVPIYSNTQKVPVVSAQDIITDNEKINNELVVKIANIFHVNANTARRYTEADGTVVYIENNATLKIHTNGMIEYKARDDGIKLSNSGGKYNDISRLNEVVGEVNNLIGTNCNIYLSSNATGDENIITFDYVCEGMPVKMEMDDMKHAVYCIVSEGYIKEYKHIIKNYEKTGEYVSTPEYIVAVDKTIQQYSALTGEIKINKLYLAYKDDCVKDKLYADWNVEVESNIITDKEKGNELE